VILIVVVIDCVVVIPMMSMQENVGIEKSCVWHARDSADGELKGCTFLFSVFFN
jgi:hypothetical protein